MKKDRDGLQVEVQDTRISAWFEQSQWRVRCSSRFWQEIRRAVCMKPEAPAKEGRSFAGASGFQHTKFPGHIVEAQTSEIGISPNSRGIPGEFAVDIHKGRNSIRLASTR